MVLFDIQDYGNCRIKREERVAVFTGFHDDRVPIPHTMTCIQQGQRSPDHDRRILFRCHEDMRAHGCGCGLPMCAGNTECVGIPF